MTEQLKIPNQVINSDWRDDVDLDYETYGTNKQEREYISPAEISKVSIEKIKAHKLNKERGHKLLTVFSRNEKLAA